MEGPPPPYGTHEPGRVGTARAPCLTNAIRLCDLKELVVCSYVHSSEDLVVEVRSTFALASRSSDLLYRFPAHFPWIFPPLLDCMMWQVLIFSGLTDNWAMQAHRKAITHHGLASCWRVLSCSVQKPDAGGFFGHLSIDSMMFDVLIFGAKSLF